VGDGFVDTKENIIGFSCKKEMSWFCNFFVKEKARLSGLPVFMPHAQLAKGA
jgi:hypothetical protein